jgi:riboflavin transporter FmnP
MKKAKIIIIAVVSILALIIIFQNREVMKTKLLFMTVEMSRALLLILTFGLGFITGLVVSFMVKKTGKAELHNQA